MSKKYSSSQNGASDYTNTHDDQDSTTKNGSSKGGKSKNSTTKNGASDCFDCTDCK